MLIDDGHAYVCYKGQQDWCSYVAVGFWGMINQQFFGGSILYKYVVLLVRINKGTFLV